MTEKLQKELNVQINAEMWSSNLYLSMAFYLKNKGLDGCANWLMKQSQEELNHAYEIADYLSKRGEKAEVGMVDVVPTGWGDVAEVFKNVYDHECHVSKLIDELVDVASAEKDKATQDFLFNPAKRNVLDLKNETCKNREKRNVLKISHTRHFKAIKKQSVLGCFYGF